MKKKSTFILSILFSCLTGNLFSQAGLDNSFGGTGKITRSISPGYDFATATAVQSDGKILVAGYATTSGNTNFILLRYLANGLMDTAFGDSGTVMTDFGRNELCMAMIIQPDGKILLAGQATSGSNTDFAVARYKVSGQPDSSFGINGMSTASIGAFDDVAQAVTLQKDGKIVLAGYSGAYPNYDFGVARFKANGVIDSSFSGDGRLVFPIGNGADIATAVKVQDNGKIVIAGRSVRAAAYDIALLRLKADGSQDIDFGSSGIVLSNIGIADDAANSLIIQPDQKILVGGYGNTGSFTDFAVLRYDTSGNLDNSFSGDGKQTIAVIGNDNDAAGAMALQSDGRILLGGNAKIGTANQFALARVKANGDIDSSFGQNGKTSFSIGGVNDIILSMAIQADGKIVACGISSNGSDYDFAVIRYIPAKSSSIQALTTTAFPLQAYPNPASGNIKLAFHLEASQAVKVELLDMQGKTVAVLSDVFMESGAQLVKLDIPQELEKGFYLLKISGYQSHSIVKILME